MIRAVVDVNLWISFLISDSFSRLEHLLTNGAVTILHSEDFLAEYRSTIYKPKLQKRFGTEAATEMLAQLVDNGEFIAVVSTVSVCRDPKDDYLLELSRDGRADYLLTGDKDLLSLETFEGTRICTLTGFLNDYGPQ